METMLVLGHLMVLACALVGNAIKSLSIKAWFGMCPCVVKIILLALQWKGLLLEWDSVFTNSLEIKYVCNLASCYQYLWNLQVILLSFSYQLSSKCDNRLFRIKLEIPKFSGYHFLEAFSHPIRCISRSRNPRTSLTWKRPTSVAEPFNKSQSFGLYNGSIELQHNSIHEIRPSPSSKRIKLGQEKTSTMEKPDVECYSDAWTTNQV
jgi:hypothetical protein